MIIIIKIKKKKKKNNNKINSEIANYCLIQMDILEQLKNLRNKLNLMKIFSQKKIRPSIKKFKVFLISNQIKTIMVIVLMYLHFNQAMKNLIF